MDFFGAGLPGANGIDLVRKIRMKSESYLYIIVLTGRSKELIIRKGENISPREIEDVLMTHPSVGAIAIVGLPDPERGERVWLRVERQTLRRLPVTGAATPRHTNAVKSPTCHPDDSGGAGAPPRHRGRVGMTVGGGSLLKQRSCVGMTGAVWGHF